MARLARIAATALIAAAAVLLVEVAVTLLYEEPLSSVYARVKQDEAAETLREVEERYPTAADRRAIAGLRSRERRIAALARRFGRRVEEGDPIGRIGAEQIGLDAVVVQGTDTADLRTGPGHFRQTPLPGQDGTVGIAGHRTTYGAPFRHVDSLRRGDPIVLKMPYATFHYRVQGTEIVDPGDIGVVRDVGYERLVLTSCHPLYSASQRFIVYARAVRERIGPPAES